MEQSLIHTTAASLHRLLSLYDYIAFFVTYVFTLSAMYFVYTAILAALWLILLINVHPFKKTALHYPSTDKAFIAFIVLSYVSVLGANIANIESHAYKLVCYTFVLSAPFVSLVYIFFVMFKWLASNRRCFRSSYP